MIDDLDITTQIQDIIGMVAGDDFEGWNDYWDDEKHIEDAIEALLTAWQEEAKRKGGRG